MDRPWQSLRNEELSLPLRGIIPPLVTPLRAQDTLDTQGLERLIEHVIAGGVHGVFILGTTGEGPGLSYRLRRKMIEWTCRQVDGRIPVLVGVTDTSYTESVHLAEYAAQVGASATVLSAPYYFPASQEDLASYVEHFVEAISLPTFLYNMPSHTKISFEIDTLRRLIQHRQIIGLKDSSGYMGYLHQAYHVVRERENFSLLVGPERHLAETVLLGGHGGVAGGANLVPALFVALYEAAASNERAKAEQLQEQVVQLGQGIYYHGSKEGSVIKGIKCALGALGICDDYVAEPFSRHLAPDKKKIIQAVHSLEALLSDDESR